MFEDMMLEDISKRKLTLFKLLTKFSDQTYSINFFENHLDYSYSRVVYLLEQIQQDLSDITNTKILLVDSKGVHSKKIVDYDFYYQYLITQSIPYRLIVSIIYYPKDNLDTFCKKNFLSRASVIRKSKKLLEYFKAFHIRLNLSGLKISGDERIIRLILYSLIWLSSQGAHLPLSNKLTINYNDVASAVSPFYPDSHSFSASRQIKLILDIVYLRIKAGYPLRENTEISPYIPLDIAYAKNFWAKILVRDNELEAEAQFSAFLLIIAPNYFREDDYRLVFLNRYLSEEKNNASNLMNTFCDFFSTQLMEDNFVWKKHPILFGNVANIIFTAAIFQKPFPTLFNLVKGQSIYQTEYYQNECYQTLVHSFTSFFSSCAKQQMFFWLLPMIPDLTETLAFLLLPLFEYSLKRNTVRVAMIAESDFLLIRQLTDFLNELSFIHLAAYNEKNLSSFDFIIGTSPYLLPKNNTLPSFIFRFTSGNDQYIDLYQELKKVQTHKKIVDE